MLSKSALQDGQAAGAAKTLLLASARQNVVTGFFLRELRVAGFAVFAAYDFREVWAICKELHFDAALVLDNFGREQEATLWRDRGPVTVLDCLRLHRIACAIKGHEPFRLEKACPTVARLVSEPLRLDEVLETLDGIVNGTWKAIQPQPDEVAAD